MPFFLLLFHANNTLSITFKHETIAPKISRVHKDFFWEFKVFGMRQKSYWCLFKTNEYWKFKWFLRKVTIHLENLKKTKNKNIMKWLQSWVLFEWIMRNHFAYSYESKAYRSKVHVFEMRKGHFFNNPFTRLKFIILQSLFEPNNIFQK